jgi:hypothetical protein
MVMVEEEKETSWSLKDGLIIIPFFASGLALTWEVGFFLRIKGGAFGLFSIAEHVTFSLQALPAALSLATLIIMASYYKNILDVYGAATGVSSSHGFIFEKFKRFFWVICLLVVLIILLLAKLELFHLRIADVNVGHVLVRIIGLVIAIAMFWLINVSRSGVMICLGILFAFTLAYGVGVDTAQNEVQSNRPLNVVRITGKGTNESSEIRVRVLRTGERGVLFFDPADRSFGLLPWDAIRRMDWSISPIMER